MELSDIDQSIDIFLKQYRKDEELYVFAYGSLIFDPCFDYSMMCRANVKSYHRDLCIKSKLYRGTLDKPGLLFGLDYGGSCTGLVFKLKKETYRESLRALWQREMVTNAYVPTKLTKVYSIPEDLAFPFSPLTFVANRESDQYANIPYEEKVNMILSATGERGSNLAYIINIWESYDKYGITDIEFDLLIKDLKREPSYYERTED